MLISVQQAAEIMDVSPQFVRVAMQQDKLPIGTAVQMSKKRWTYHISPKLLAEYIGQDKLEEYFGEEEEI